MLTWLWILLGILAFFALLFLLPVSIRVGYNNEVTLSAGLPGIYFPILPKKPKKIKLNNFSYKKYRKLLEKERLAEEQKKQKLLEKERKKKSSAKIKKQDKAKKLPPEEPSDEPSAVQLILPIVGGILDTFFGKLRVKVLRMKIIVGGSDATQIAMMYGVISQSVAYLMELIAQKTKFRRARGVHISVQPDFLLDRIAADIEIIFRLRVVDLLSTGITFLIRFIKQKFNNTPKSVKLKVN